MFIIRKIVGSILLFLNWVFTPSGLLRESKLQSDIDTSTTKLKLYQFKSCPFCIKVRRAMKRMSLNIETRDAKNNSTFRHELESEGGKIKVPCLKIENSDGSFNWLYESSEIIEYLKINYC